MSAVHVLGSQDKIAFFIERVKQIDRVKQDNKGQKCTKVYKNTLRILRYERPVAWPGLVSN